MKTIPLSEIVIEEGRQRKVFDPAELQALVEDIAYSGHGLLHPILLREDENGRKILLAGERRYRAVMDMGILGLPLTHEGTPVPDGEIPYLMFGELSELEAEEIEFAENEIRTQLSWQERAAASAKLKSLRTRQAELRGEPAPSIQDIVEELHPNATTKYGPAFQQVRREILVAKHLDDPEVRAAGSASEAFKILQKKEQVQKNLERAAALGESFFSEHTCINADSGEWIKSCPNESYDVILTDPPYGMGADEFSDSGKSAAGYSGHSYKDDDATFEKVLEILRETYRIAKAAAHLYIFCDIDRFHQLRAEMEDVGWVVFRTPLIWYKPSAFRAPWPEHGPQRKYECILYALKGSRKTTRIAPDVLTYAPDPNLGHMAQKPVALLHDLLMRSCLPGDSVLDLFCGSGGIFPAAQSAKVIATGVEIDKNFYGLALGRLEEIAKRLSPTKQGEAK